MSVNISSTNWTLSTPGGIKYKLVEGYPKGSFEDETASIEEQYIIRANQLNAFIAESFPSTLVMGGQWFFRGKRVCPHHNRLYTKRVAFEPFDETRPCDPFNVHGADVATYSENLKLTISYSVDEDQESEDNNNESFLTVTADTGGEWLVVDAAEDAVWAGEGAWEGLDEETEEFQLPASQLVPKTQWNVKWPKFPNSVLPDMVTRCRKAFGKVNSEAMPLFQDAVAATILFTGFSYSQEYSWKEGPAVSFDMSFDEKFIEDGNVFDEDVTHQHTYRPGKGFQKLLINDEALYKTNDHNDLFT